MEKIDIVNPGTFQFTQPKFQLGQQVKIRNDLVGHVAGLIFYPDTVTWSYGIYLPDYEGGKIYEVWYGAEEITPSVDN